MAEEEAKEVRSEFAQDVAGGSSLHRAEHAVGGIPAGAAIGGEPEVFGGGSGRHTKQSRSVELGGAVIAAGHDNALDCVLQAVKDAAVIEREIAWVLVENGGKQEVAEELAGGGIGIGAAKALSPTFHAAAVL